MKLLILSVLVIGIIYIYYKFAYKNYWKEQICIAIIIAFVVSLFFPQVFNFVLYDKTEKTEVTITATDTKNDLSLGTEVLLRYVELDGNRYDAINYITEGNWIYNCGGAHWRNYNVEESVTDQIKILIPEGRKMNLIFQGNKWRGIAKIKYDKSDRFIDFYSDTSSSDKEVKVALDSNITVSRNLVIPIYMVLFIGLIMIVMLVFSTMFKVMSVKNKQEYISDTTVLILIMLIILAIGMTFTNSPWSRIIPWVDSDLYLYQGFATNLGDIPYKDIFENKGPVLFLIQYLGYRITGSYIGVWYIEMLTLITTFFFLYKTFMLFLSRFNSIVGIILIINLLPRYLERGNYLESYSIAFITIAMYIIVRYFKNNVVEVGRINCIIIGVLFATVFFIRANTIALWVAFCPIILFKLIYTKEYKEAIKFIFYFVIGTALVSFPIVLYLCSNGIVKDFVYAFFIVSFKYANRDNGIVNILETALFFAGNYNFIITSIGLLLAVTVKKFNVVRNHLLIVGAIIFLMITVYFCSMSSYTWLHYGIVLIPAYCIGYISFLGYFDKVLELTTSDKQKNKIIAIMSIIIITLTPYGFIVFSKDNIWITYANFNQSEEKTISNLIKTNTSKEDRISVYGANCNYYLLSERLSISKYYDALIDLDEKMQQEYIDDIISKEPKAFVVRKDDKATLNNSLNEYLEKTYILKYEGDTTLLYLKK